MCESEPFSIVLTFCREVTEMEFIYLFRTHLYRYFETISSFNSMYNSLNSCHCIAFVVYRLQTQSNLAYLRESRKYLAAVVRRWSSPRIFIDSIYTFFLFTLFKLKKLKA